MAAHPGCPASRSCESVTEQSKIVIVDIGLQTIGVIVDAVEEVLTVDEDLVPATVVKRVDRLGLIEQHAYSELADGRAAEHRVSSLVSSRAPAGAFAVHAEIGAGSDSGGAPASSASTSRRRSVDARASSSWRSSFTRRARSRVRRSRYRSRSVCSATAARRSRLEGVGTETVINQLPVVLPRAASVQCGSDVHNWVSVLIAPLRSC